MNFGAPWPEADAATARVLSIQTKLHQWSVNDRNSRFDDLYNLVADPAFLLMAWTRVRGNKGARSAGVDGQTARDVEKRGVAAFLTELRSDLKAGRFTPLPVRERRIPKAGGKWRRLGIPATRDRVVQAALKLVLEPILEADFLPCSYGFRPNRRAHDALAEVHFYASCGYHWVVEGDIEACFDNIDHAALMERLRRRIGDRRILALVKAFLKAGLLGEDGLSRETHTGTPQGGILSPLLSNLALSTLDDHLDHIWQETPTAWKRAQRRKRGGATYRLIRYADDFVIMVNGDRYHAEGIQGDIAAVLATVGLRLAPLKTKTVHVDEGFDFLGHRIQRAQQRGSTRKYVYTFPAKGALRAITRKVKAISRQDINQPLIGLLRQLEPVLRGWANYFRHASSSDTFGYLRHYTWQRVIRWLRRKHRRANMRWLRRRYTIQGWWPEQDGVRLFEPTSLHIERYLYRGARIPVPWVLSDS
jgi:RNA-directed DNA polymerase